MGWTCRFVWASQTADHMSDGSTDRRPHETFVTEAPQRDRQAVPPDHSGLAAKRVAVGAVGGIVVASIAVAKGASWSVAALGATDVAALVFVVWVWISIAGADVGETSQPARAEDASRAAAEAVLLGAGAASLTLWGSRSRRRATPRRPTAAC